ncbi:calcium-binding protein [Nocardioides humilatus]|uniref:Calcium-binding protein n=1 Tax=Nocardioides humilatus TaxID=2607660 RepID=A0A5B1LFT2_9ACTN|nr:calcium-binding protein [Nocardioides humilatus]KAA1419611.1 calcium-binding protein [Nocardioides humilatus]
MSTLVIKSARTAIVAGLLGLGTAGVTVLAPAPAFAVSGTLLYDSGVVLIGIQDSGGDNVSISDVGANFRVAADKGMTLTSGAPCTQVSAFIVTCPLAGVDAWELTGSNAHDVVFGEGTSVDGELDLGGGADVYQPGHGKDFIHGGSGTDMVDYHARTAALDIDLSTPNGDGEAGEDDYIFGDNEQIFGGQGDDKIKGGPNADYLFGHAGDDTLYGTVGQGDFLDGYEGYDSVEYDVPANVPLDITLDEVANDGPIGQGDKIIRTERVVGGLGDDVIRGSVSSDWIVGGGGKDTLLGDNGNDLLYAEGNGSVMDGGQEGDTFIAYKGTGKTIIGGVDQDTVSYSGYVEWDLSYEDYSTQSVKVDLDGAADDGYAGQKDRVGKDVEIIEGTHFGDDELKGSSADNELYGYGGNDILTGGGGDDLFAPQPVLAGPADSDLVNGGGGTDLVTYANGPTEVVVTLDNDANDGPSGDLDNVKSNVEGIEGSAQDDDLFGSRAANTLLGGDGADELHALGGNDVIDGQGGDDFMFGGTGNDTVSYADHTDNVSVALGPGGSGGGDFESDSIDGDIENVIGGSGDDLLTGSDGKNKIFGGFGEDDIQGLGGNDVLDGGEENDTIYAGSVADGADKISGGNGVDLIDYRDRTLSVSVTFDGKANDGQASEKDLIDLIENVRGGAGADVITGNEYVNILEGGDGADTISGADNNDFLYGEGGNDFLDGGDHTDFGDGGPGVSDTCVSIETAVNCEL